MMNEFGGMVLAGMVTLNDDAVDAAAVPPV
jgi:hypothetical protein